MKYRITDYGSKTKRKNLNFGCFLKENQQSFRELGTLAVTRTDLRKMKTGKKRATHKSM